MGAKAQICTLGLKGRVRGGVNDWGDPRIDSRVRNEWRAEVRGGYPPWTGQISVEQAPR